MVVMLLYENAVSLLLALGGGGEAQTELTMSLRRTDGAKQWIHGPLPAEDK